MARNLQPMDTNVASPPIDFYQDSCIIMRLNNQVSLLRILTELAEDPSVPDEPADTQDPLIDVT